MRAAACDVTDEDQVQAAFAACAREFGGLDILVANAGLASSAADRGNHRRTLAQELRRARRGLLPDRRAPAFPLMKQQKGGSIVFIGSKNALAATTNASAYASAKAAAVHLARCLALEGAADGIRVNVVNPDAVIRGSKIWDGDWRKERAGAYGIDPGRGTRGVLPQALDAEAATCCRRTSPRQCSTSPRRPRRSRRAT